MTASTAHEPRVCKHLNHLTAAAPLQLSCRCKKRDDVARAKTRDVVKTLWRRRRRRRRLVAVDYCSRRAGDSRIVVVCSTGATRNEPENGAPSLNATPVSCCVSFRGAFLPPPKVDRASFTATSFIVIARAVLRQIHSFGVRGKAGRLDHDKEP